MYSLSIINTGIYSKGVYVTSPGTRGTTETHWNCAGIGRGAERSQRGNVARESTGECGRVRKATGNCKNFIGQGESRRITDVIAYRHGNTTGRARDVRPSIAGRL